ncbi:hypothetical protein, partial [Campylobacter concisus]|uniref:hypothetical protein n=1 Tax=Campylobacter concisus TaxID=199 RepID=UPI000CD84BB3
MKKLILFLSFIMLLNAENLDEMCQSEGDIRANLTSCYKAATKIYNSSSDDKDFKKLQKIFLLACENDMKEGCYSAALIYINGYNDVSSELNQTIILNRYARFLNYALLDNGKKEDKMTANSYFQRSCELGFKKGWDMRNFISKRG